MPFPEVSHPSPNFTAAFAHEQLGVCFHHSVMPFGETIAHMLSAENKVSYHVLIASDGTRARLVADEHIAWHAGESIFQGRTRCNYFLSGVSFAGDTYAAPLTEAQLASAIDWLSARWARRSWSVAWMTDHRQIAPGRKDDLNPVEWARLLAAITKAFPHT
ncbi:MAG TPA: N-acetylmuramoyl-L-alanine amidase [Rariglobus sp.]|jgi:AmpD protein|nr:N-acetylmuramoyl-L-alanine amidase [Rariglobus sp.]